MNLMKDWLFILLIASGVLGLIWAAQHDLQRTPLPTDAAAQPLPESVSATAAKESATTAIAPSPVKNSLDSLSQDALREKCLSKIKSNTIDEESNAACAMWASREPRRASQLTAPPDSKPHYSTQYTTRTPSNIPSQNEVALERADHHCDGYGPGLIAERQCRSLKAQDFRNQCRRTTQAFDMSTGERRDSLRTQKEIDCYVADHFKIIKS